MLIILKSLTVVLVCSFDGVQGRFPRPCSSLINSRPSGQAPSAMFSTGSEKTGGSYQLAEAERDNISRLMKIADIIRA